MCVYIFIGNRSIYIYIPGNIIRSCCDSYGKKMIDERRMYEMEILCVNRPA